jgi:enoyl-CoA hydratase/carnithine racemase
MSLALACDMVVASTNARFAAIFARRGLSLDCGASWLLPRLVGIQKAKEIALLADMFGADEAKSIGLVNRVVADDELDAAVDELARRLSRGPTIALSMTKRLLNSALTSSLSEALEAEAMAQAVNSSTDDTSEGLLAFVEKRDASFKGR